MNSIFLIFALCLMAVKANTDIDIYSTFNPTVEKVVKDLLEISNTTKVDLELQLVQTFADHNQRVQDRLRTIERWHELNHECINAEVAKVDAINDQYHKALEACNVAADNATDKIYSRLQQPLLGGHHDLQRIAQKCFKYNSSQEVCFNLWLAQALSYTEQASEAIKTIKERIEKALFPLITAVDTCAAKAADEAISKSDDIYFNMFDCVDKFEIDL